MRHRNDGAGVREVRGGAGGQNAGIGLVAFVKALVYPVHERIHAAATRCPDAMHVHGMQFHLDFLACTRLR
jgi:hypothetical protein